MVTRPEAMAAPAGRETTWDGAAWWSIALRGVFAIIFGVIALSHPRAAIAGIVIVFAIWALADGAVAFGQAFLRGRAGMRWGWYVFEAIASVGIGIIALAFPHITFLALVFLVAIRAIALGLFELIGAFSWKGVDARWLLGVTGVVSLLFGILLLSNPMAAGVALIWAMGVYAIIFGAMLFGHGLHVFMLRHQTGLPGQMHAGQGAASA